MTDQLDEARMSAAVKLQRAYEREQQKSAASRQRGQELLNQNKKKEDQKIQQTNEGTTQPSGTDKIEVAGNEVPAKQPKGKTVKSFKFFTTNESYTFDSAAMAKQELADAKNRKHRKRGKVANLLRKLGMKEGWDPEKFGSDGSGAGGAGAGDISKADKKKKPLRKEELEVEQQLQEVLSKDASAGEWIKDFIDSDNPKFAGKSKEKRKQMALAAYYAKQRNEEVEIQEAKKDDDVPFDGPYTKGPKKDEFGNTVKPKNVAKFLAKRAMRKLEGKPVKEEAEQLEERNKENALKRKSMDASRGARFKLNNPVPEAGEEHKTPQAHNKAIGRALRNEESEQIDEISKELEHRYFKARYAQHPNRAKTPKKVRQGMDKVINRALRRSTIDTPGAAQDFKDQEKKRGVGHVRDHVELQGNLMSESLKPKSLREFIETIQEAKPLNVDKVNTAGEAPHEEKWEAAKKPAVKKESFTAEELLVALKEGLWPGTPEHTAKFGDKYAQKQGGGAGVKKGYRYGGGAQKPDAEDDNDADDKPAKKPKNK